MRNRFDYLAKQIGEKSLAPSGTTIAHDEITPETQYADLRHEPDPACQAARDRIGLLGRLASVPCIIEVYSDAPDAEQFRACLAKHLASWQGRVRQMRSENSKRGKQGQPREVFVDSFLWIIAAGAPTKLLTKLKLEAAPGWPRGVYWFGGDVLRVGVVVASELPCDATTFLVRVMAAGPLLAHAAKELATLPKNAHERAVAEPVLLAFQHMLGPKPSRTPYEQEFLVTMYKSFEEVRTEAHAETQANAVLTVLRVRGIPVSATVRKRILAQRDLARLERWFEKAITATSMVEILDDPS